MVNPKFLYSCYNDYVNKTINLGMRANYLDVIW